MAGMKVNLRVADPVFHVVSAWDNDGEFYPKLKREGEFFCERCGKKLAASNLEDFCFTCEDEGYPSQDLSDVSLALMDLGEEGSKKEIREKLRKEYSREGYYQSRDTRLERAISQFVIVRKKGHIYTIPHVRRFPSASHSILYTVRTFGGEASALEIFEFLQEEIEEAETLVDVHKVMDRMVRLGYARGKKAKGGRRYRFSPWFGKVIDALNDRGKIPRVEFEKLATKENTMKLLFNKVIMQDDDLNISFYHASRGSDK